MGIDKQSITLKAPAKLNIRLKVTARRPDGYHELVSIMVPIGLFDYLEMGIIPSGIRIDTDCLDVPNDEKNLICQAGRAFFSKSLIKKGLSARLTKNIPIAAGLGGGSSDAACTLKALNEMCSEPLTAEDLIDLASHLGADVPFFLESRPCIARGIGEILEPIERWPRLWYVIVSPPLAVSTSWVYQNLKLKLTTGEYDFIIEALGKDPIDISEILENDLETVTATHYPVVNSIKKALLNAGAEGALMSGSGPSVFGIFRSESHALRAKKLLTSQDLGGVFVAPGIGVSSSGKTRAFGARIRRFESSHPSQEMDGEKHLKTI